VCAHELGHLFLHKNTNAIFMDTYTQFNTDKFEIEANKFAMELLISDDFLLEHQEFTTTQISRMLGYSEELIRLRFCC
jgi:Zn-dependent peptidase ImmA (M78 family)